MGYFEGITNGSFKKDENGRTVFYPWWIFGKGRILTDEATEGKVRSFVLSFHKISIPIIIIFSIGRKWGYSLLIFIILVSWYFLKTRNLVAGLPFSDDKLTLKESYTKSAAEHSRFTLWLLFIMSMVIVFIASGAWLTLSARSTKDNLIAGMGVIFFGMCTVVIGYMLKVKQT